MVKAVRSNVENNIERDREQLCDDDLEIMQNKPYMEP